MPYDTRKVVSGRARAASLVCVGAIAALTLLAAGALAAAEGDWPQWRHDANRSGAGPCELPDRLELVWHRDQGNPEPAFSHQARICADAGYAPVAAGGLVFVPSNRDDCVTAFQLATGRRVWRFTTEGPVRFAPVAAKGRLWFGSDDGHVYCLNAADGSLVWRLRGAPASFPDSRLLVNGRLVSRWPVRGAPVLDGGVLYFGAGVWPEEGVYVVAADAESGELRWRSGALSHVADGMSDHGRDYDLGLPPQGYPAVIDGRLLIASGRSPAAFCDPATGVLEPYTTMYVKTNAPRGWWYVSGIGTYWFQGGNILGTCREALGELPPDRMPLERFADEFGFREAELKRLGSASPRSARQKAKAGLDRIKVIENKGRATAVFNFSDPLSAGMVAPREPLANDIYFLENRPLFRVDPVHRANMHAETGVFSEPVWTADTLYWSEFDEPREHVVERGDTRPRYPRFDAIVARDLARSRWTVTRPDLLREREFPVKWRLRAPYKVLIKSGGHLYGGIDGEVAAIRIPRDGEEPRVVWMAPVDGVPLNVLAAAGRLVVSTSTGHLYCFGQSDTAAVEYAAPEPAPQVDPRWSRIVDTATSGRSAPGYALVLGFASGQLAKSFASRDGWQTVVIEPDAQKAAVARTELAAEGLLGKRLQIVTGPPGSVEIAPLWADAVAAEDLSSFRHDMPKTLELVAESLRPFSGVAMLPLDGEEPAALREACPERLNYHLDEAEGMTRLRRIAPPPGAADWTHEAGGASNTYASCDGLVRAPFELLWLSGDVDRFGTPPFEYQHSRGPFPLYWHGQIFFIASNVVHSADMYTGRYLWRYELPETDKTQALTWVHRPFSRPDDDNFLILDGRLYLVSGADCHVLDAQSGRRLATLAIPDELRPRDGSGWRELRGAGGRLLAVFGNVLACLDPLDGRVQWTHQSTKKDVTFAVGGESVFSVDYDAPPQFGGTRTASDAVLYALALESGHERWRDTLAVPPLAEYSIAGVQGGAIDWVAPIKPLLAYNEKHDVLLGVVNRAAWTAYQGADGTRLWEKKIQWPPGQIHHLEPPTVLDDVVIPHQRDYAASGGAFDVRSGEVVDLGNIVPSKRGCSRIVGNDFLLTYRDAATAIYDLADQRLLRNNAIRSGCTNGMVPAGGILNAPNFANGCVCNYPIFASYALRHVEKRDAGVPDYYAPERVHRPEPAGARRMPD